MLADRNKRFEAITLEDVNNAIAILEYYIQQMNKAKSLIARFSQLSGGRAGGMAGGMGQFGNLGFDDIVNMSVAVEEKKRGRKFGEDTASPELTEDDLIRMKASVDKVKAKATTQATQ